MSGAAVDPAVPLTGSTALDIERGLHTMQRVVHTACIAAGWYSDPLTGAPLRRNVPEMLALIHSEVSEALEGYRKDQMDNHLPERRAVEVELADAMIRIADLAQYLGLDLAGAVVDKMRFNATRADHKLAARAKPGGKKF